MNIARAKGIKAYAPKGVALPSKYDPQSGQPWTRDRLRFVLHEIKTRAMIRSRKVIVKSSEH